MSLRFNKFALLCVIFIGFFLSEKALGAKRAMIIVDKAIIYADKDLKAPMGFAKRGKIIWVGEKERKFRTILPVAVIDRVGYVRIKDILMLSGISEEEIKRKQEKSELRTVQEHPYYNTIDQSLEDDLNVDNIITAQYRLTNLRGDIATVAEALGEETSPTATGFNLLYEHYPKLYSIGWSLGFGYMVASTSNIEIAIFDIIGQLHYTFLKLDAVGFDLTFGLNGSPQGTFKAAGSTTELSSSSYGYMLGAKVRVFTDKPLRLSAFLNYAARTFVDMKSSNQSASTNNLTLESQNELEIGLGLSLAF